MLIRGNRFNIYLAAALACFCACQTPEAKRKKQPSSLRVHAEANPDAAGRTEPATIHRDPLVVINIQKAPFLTESQVKEAKVVDVIGGFALRLQFDRRGTWMLEQYSADSRGRHFAIYSQWVSPPTEKLNEGRWLAAPLIARRITNGVLVFTPNTTRAEADQIAVGLNNVAKKLGTGKEPE